MAADGLVDPLRYKSTWLLVLSFALVVGLALAGTLLKVFFAADNELFKEAMRIIGVTGPLGTGTQSAIDAFGRNNPPPQHQLPSQPPAANTPSPWGKS